VQSLHGATATDQGQVQDRFDTARLGFSSHIRHQQLMVDCITLLRGCTWMLPGRKLSTSSLQYLVMTCSFLMVLMMYDRLAHDGTKKRLVMMSADVCQHQGSSLQHVEE
jgi:hypothetical protein